MANNKTTNTGSDRYNTQTFSNNIEIDKFFKNFGSNGFAEWFNANITRTNPWKHDYLGHITSYSITKNQWEVIWANINTLYGKSVINLVEFLSLNSIMVNETGGSFIPKSELVGNSGNPGISYAFNKIGGKSSYNTNSINKDCYTLFRDADYISAHGNKGMSNILRNTNDVRWRGSTFPYGFAKAQGFSKEDETNPSGVRNGFLIEADFFKFRGRGFIQTTGRANYKKLVEFIINYKGNDPAINAVINRWRPYGNNLDRICTISTNQEWDTLFQKSNNTVANYAVYIFFKSSGVLNIDPRQSPSNLAHSIEKVGKLVNGSKYGREMMDRVLIQLDIINGNTTAPTPAPYTHTNSPMGQEESRGERSGQSDDVQYNGNNIDGSLSSLTNIFKPTAIPAPITFDIK